MNDRFTTATADLAEHNPYHFEGDLKTFGHPTFTHLGHDQETRDAGCLFNCDPMPFGD